MNRIGATVVGSKRRRMYQAQSYGGGLYFVGFIGAVVYFITTATGFWNGVLGVLKAAVWPAFLVFEAFSYLKI